MKATSTMVLVTLTVVQLTPANLFAATAAYWRHEEGAAGTFIPNGANTVLDSSGNLNHMQTFNSATTSATYTNTVSPLALRSELPNTRALDFGPGGDGGGLDDDNYTNGKAIHTQLFEEQTVEFAFKMDAIVGYQAIFGKDGKPLGDEPDEGDGSPIPPFKVLIRGDSFPGPTDTPRPGTGAPNQLFVEWIDGDEDIHYLASGETVEVDTWYHVAITRTATDAELWIAGATGDYDLKDAISGGDFAGTSGEIEVYEPLGYSVGRGMFNNSVADWADAIIDEVRISDVALTPEEFLFVTVPADDSDLDGDGDVDGNDFLLLQRGVPAFDSSDFDAFKTNFGSAVAAAGAVPEPSTGLLAIALLGAAVYSGRSGLRRRSMIWRSR